MKNLIAAAAVACLAAAAAAQEPSMNAKLVDPGGKGLKRLAVVELNLTGLRIVDPATAKEKAKKGQGHVHFQIDGGPVIDTTATTLSFRELPDGKHTITVTLAGNDHNPLGPAQSLAVTIP